MRPATFLAAFLVGAAIPALAAAPDISACVGCHGPGTSETQGIPSLGGMPALYVTNQLFMFREGQRKADPMNDLAEPMSDDDLKAYADAIAALPAPEGVGKADADMSARADAVIAKHRCQSCHGKDLGGDKGVPRIRGQREDYLAAALRGYKSSERAGFDPQMNEVAGELSQSEISDLAAVLSRR